VSTAIAEGKTKLVFDVGKGRVLLVFKDTITAGDGDRRDQMNGKGEINAKTSAILFSELTKGGVKNHFIEQKDERSLVVRKLQMIPVEVVVRNIATGSIVKRLPIKEGHPFDPPLVEFFLKDDARHDPLLNYAHMEHLGLMRREEAIEVERLALAANEVLQDFLDPKGLVLYDLKVEVGRDGSSLMLGDELTLDSMRVRTKSNGEVLDKDLYRRGENLEVVKKAYVRFLEMVSN
jgi:phosphoribosylaminoimidazole-succinocarboxamide synthase